jgi:hypothetical protein
MVKTLLQRSKVSRGGGEQRRRGERRGLILSRKEK